MTSVVRPTASSASDAWIAASVSVSSAEVASSRIRIGGFFRKMRAIASRCFWPPDSLTPRSPTMVSSPAGQVGDHRVEPRPARGLDDLGLARIEPAIGDVLADGAGEEEDILLDDADLAAQSGERHVADIDAVDGDPPGIDLVEARQQATEASSCRHRTDRRRQRFRRPRWSGRRPLSTGRPGA